MARSFDEKHTLIRDADNVYLKLAKGTRPGYGPEEDIWIKQQELWSQVLDLADVFDTRFSLER
jgi:hypothetical protein